MDDYGEHICDVLAVAYGDEIVARIRWEKNGNKNRLTPQPGENIEQLINITYKMLVSTFGDEHITRLPILYGADAREFFASLQ